MASVDYDWFYFDEPERSNLRPVSPSPFTVLDKYNAVK